jgi:hypothetical protein
MVTEQVTWWLENHSVSRWKKNYIWDFLSADKRTAYLSILAIYAHAPMIYTAPCVMLLMRTADFFGPKMALACRLDAISQGPYKVSISRAQPHPTCQSNWCCPHKKHYALDLKEIYVCGSTTDKVSRLLFATIIFVISISADGITVSLFKGTVSRDFLIHVFS